MKKYKINIFKLFAFTFMIAFSFIYALPNFYDKAPSVVIIPKNEIVLKNDFLNKIKELNIGKIEINIDGSVNIMFKSLEEQMIGYEKIKNQVDLDSFFINLTLLSTSPKWLDYFGSNGTSLGLDLMGGVHFLMEVDSEYIYTKTMSSYMKKIDSEILDKGIIINKKIVYNYSNEIEKLLNDNYIDVFSYLINGDKIELELTPNYLKSTIDYAVKQNIFTLKNRVNELGVAEPIVQREGRSRIVVQLPGIQDTQKAKDLIGTTASLSFKKLKEDDIVDEYSSVFYNQDKSVSYVFFNESIIEGDSIIDASSGINPENNSSLVSVILSGDGGDTVLEYTSKNKGTYMGSILTETSYRTIINDKGESIRVKSVTDKVINVARIQGVFSTRFQITGLDDKNEAHDLAILLRSGSLAAPIDIIEERTIGPNMGAENVENGKKSIIIGFFLVLVTMIFKYRILGVVANFCVFINLLLLLSILSILNATLTLPGIAGILLTVGMAVDGNIIIFERIKEEFLKYNDMTIAVKNGFEKAFSTVIDANVTTLIAAFILFFYGTGPVKGFAVTLSIGILTSIITSVFLSRFIVEILYSKKNTKEISNV